MEGRESCSLRSRMSRWLGDGADEQIRHLRDVGGAWTSAPDDADLDPVLYEFSDSAQALRVLGEILREAQDSGWMRRFRTRKGAHLPLLSFPFSMSAHRENPTETDLVEFRHGAIPVPARPLRQLQWAVLDRVRGGLPHGRAVFEETEESKPGPNLVEQWQLRMDEALAADDDRRARALLALHCATKRMPPGEGRNVRLKDLRKRWQALGEEIGLIPRLQGGPRLLISKDTLHDLYAAGVGLAKMARAYDANPDRAALGALEPEPPEGVDRWARLLHVGAVLSHPELEILLQPLPKRIPGHSPSVGVHVVEVLALRLTVSPGWIANKLDLGSLKPYVSRINGPSRLGGP